MATPVPSKSPPQTAPPQPAAAPVQSPPVATKTPAPVKTAPKPPTKAPSKLGLIKRTRLVAAGYRFVIYGPEGVGKSSLAADADPVFVDLEQSSKFLETRRYPFHPGEIDEYQPRSYDEVCSAIDDLAEHPDPSIGVVVVDTGDALEALIHAHICRKNQNASSIEKVGGGYGKGYRAAVEVLREFQSKLDRICANGVHVVIVCHSQTTTFKDPEGEDYNRYTLKVHSSDKVSFAGQLKEWADVVGFLHFDGGSKKTDEDARAIGWATNRRLLELQRSAAWDAKWRLLTPMPSQIEIDIERPWAPIADAIARERDTRPLADRIKAELDRIGAEEFTTAAGTETTRTAVLAMIATADQPTLSRVLSGLAKTTAPAQEQ